MEWKLISYALDREQLPVCESLFALGNGYLGVRGNFEEGYPPDYRSVRGTYINGFYDLADLHYGEKAFGYPEQKQKMINLIDAQSLTLCFGEDAEPFSLFSGDVLDYQRTLDLKNGFTQRSIHWRSPRGKEIRLNFRRLVSFDQPELFAIEVQIEPINYHGKVILESKIDGQIHNFADKDDPRVGSDDNTGLLVNEAEADGGFSWIIAEAHHSDIQLACTTSLTISCPCTLIGTHHTSQAVTTAVFNLDHPVTILKKAIYTDSRHHSRQFKSAGALLIEKWQEQSFDELLKKQQDHLQSFWLGADVQIEGDEPIQESLRFSIFQLLQACGRDGFSSIAAKGLSGEGYEGHYFWDTEIFMLPFFLLTHSELARNLLFYRYSILGSARQRAREMGHASGALFPWRTISGDECSSFFPAGTAQYHINGDIAYSCVQYYLATGDITFLANYGCEILVETARLWLTAGHYAKGSFRIDAVTGPDEYTALVNNNYYTNLLAKYNLEWAAKSLKILAESRSENLISLKKRIDLLDKEPAEWLQAAAAMYLPYDPELKINPQDDSFLQKAVWDFAHTPASHYPLLLHYHPLTLYRYQVCKQADTVLAHFLIEDEQSLDTIKRSYAYYEKVTTHDSSLSTCTFSIMAARLGDIEKAYAYFKVSARIDLDNVQKNTRDGLHLANMGGTWMAVIYGFAGVRIKADGLWLRPSLPQAWKSYAFHLNFWQCRLLIKIEREEMTCRLEQGDSLTLHINDQPFQLKKEQPLTLAMSDVSTNEKR
ncbi:MAG: glycoside hydrolase family 65 protein [Sporolactobacillus sp.]